MLVLVVFEFAHPTISVLVVRCMVRLVERVSLDISWTLRLGWLDDWSWSSRSRSSCRLRGWSGCSLSRFCWLFRFLFIRLGLLLDWLLLPVIIVSIVCIDPVCIIVVTIRGVMRCPGLFECVCVFDIVIRVTAVKVVVMVMIVIVRIRV